jgi:energy-coupling factor transporter ATP-binding protein EcfA2
MRITKILLKDFRAFRGEYVINLHEGRNLLIYGENGSGKSSLFQALNLFFAPAPISFREHKNIFIQTDDGYVKLEIGDGVNPSKTYEWEQTAHPSSEALIVESAKTKGFLDYRSLLETHFVHRDADYVNVFDLLVNNLLANIQSPISQIPLSEEWKALQATLAERQSASRRERLGQQLSDFNAGFVNLLSGLTVISNQILALFDQNVNIQLELSGQGLVIATPTAKQIDNQAINLSVNYYDHPLTLRHHHFLNEARLSAIATSIYLGALLLNPPSQLRVLFLDDVLIGLDMSNRLPLLKVLTQFFADWQIILTTYDRVWFEMIWQRFEDSKAWERVEFFCSKTDDGDIPIYEYSKNYLAIASQHLAANDLKAAAIYIRSAYEHAIKRFCSKHNLSVRYCDNPKEQKSEDFWRVVVAQKKRDGTDILSAAVVAEVELCRASILNQLSHTAPVTLVRQEVEDARRSVETMQTMLQQIQKNGLQ